MENLFFFLHIVGISVSFLSILIADRQGFSWFSSKKATLEEVSLKKVHRFVWVGLMATIVSGFFLFWDRRFYLLNESPAFIGKMIFVFALIVNGIFIGRLLKISTLKPYKELTTKEKLPLFISGAVSSVSWAGAFILAFFL